MRKMQLFIPVLILIVLLAALIGHRAYGQQKQQVKITKTVQSSEPLKQNDSVKMVVKIVKDTTLTNNPGDIDSLFLSLLPIKGLKDSILFRLMRITGEDTLITNIRSDSLTGKWISDLRADSLLSTFPEISRQFNEVEDSVLQLSFDDLFDPLNLEDLINKSMPNFNIDSLKQHVRHIILSNDSIDKNIISINDDGKYLRIEKDGEIVIIDKENGIKNMDSDIQVVKNKNGEKEIVLQTRILLDDLSSEDKKELKSKGLKTSRKEPDFEYIKFYPNPSNDAINISFRLNEKADTEVKIINMLGQTVYEERLKDFQGDYNQSVNVEQFGQGDYVLQIIHGNRAITRKIIVE